MSLPFFHILVPAGASPQIIVTLTSLRLQIYPNWQVAILGDDVDSDAQAAFQRQLGQKPIQWLDGEDLTQLARSGNDYVFPLLPGDELTPDALAEMALAAKANKSCDLVYADQAERFSEADPLTPFFKPGWSPETLIANDYIGRAAVKFACLPNDFPVRTFDAVDLWSVWLNLSRKPALSTGRCERVLYRIAAVDADDIGRLESRAVAMIHDHLSALGIKGKPFRPEWAKRLAVLAFHIDFPDTGPKVSILIPTKNNFAVFKRCIESLPLTTYDNYEVIVIDNASDEPQTIAYLNEIRGRDKIRILRIPSLLSGFSYSYVNNAAAKEADGDYLLFLNDDTEVIAPKWLSHMVGWGQFPGIGSVGAKLYFANDQVQHSGLIHNLLDGVLPAPAFKLTGRTSIGDHAQDHIVRNYAAVTAACMLTPRDLFLKDGGFDDVDFSVAYNDCDYGFRLSRRGLRHVCVPTAELYHYEGITRGRGRGNDKISEEVSFIRRYADWTDPYFNRNLSQDSFEFQPVRHTVLPDLPIRAPLTIALFSHNLNYEGAPYVLLDIARGLARGGLMHVVIFSLVEGPLRAEFEAAGCQVIVKTNVGVFGAKSEEELQSVLTPIIDEMRRLGVNVALANTVVAHWGVVAAQMLDLPALWVIHESEAPFSHLEGYGAAHVDLARRAFAKSYRNIFVARSTRDLYAPYSPRDNLSVIYNGFNAKHAADELRRYDRQEERAKLGVGPGDLLFVLPGTVCERKSQQDLVAALQLLPASASACRFVIVGDRDGNYSRALHAMADRLPEHLRNRLSIIKETPEVWRYYGAADGMVFTSRLESFPRVIQEAMYSGLAIVTTPVFGISEQLRDQQSGLFFEPGDVHALAAALGRVAGDLSLRQKLAHNARISLGRFPTITAMQEKYVALVQEAALSHARPNPSRPQRAWIQAHQVNHSRWWNIFCGN
ncbi:glycosyltransferase [Sphingobium yanoikuyae]|uniref:glycosyltransferase n=1 Tax=Sphingobium yanoikuyae TaxID=13690 RepID=UPI0008476A93|nr:glycosyltransferase [Sphingobium yanoikuyae]